MDESKPYEQIELEQDGKIFIQRAPRSASLVLLFPPPVRASCR